MGCKINYNTFLLDEMKFRICNFGQVTFMYIHSCNLNL